MITTEHYIEGRKVTPANHKDFAIELDKSKDENSESLTVVDFNFVNDDARYINTFIASGKSGGFGIFQGLRHRIVVKDKSNVLEFNNYIDLTDSFTVNACNDITVKSKPFGEVDFINDRVFGYSFEYLFEETNLLLKSDFRMCPYILNTVPNYREAVIALIGTFFIITEVRNRIAELTAIVSEAATYIDSVGAIVRAIVMVLYLITLIISLVKLIQDLILLLIQPVKYHAGMYVKDLFRIGFEHIGLEFKSTIFDSFPYNKMLLIPQKRNVPANEDDDRILGFTTPDRDQQRGYYDGTFGDFLSAFKSMFNAKLVPEMNGDVIRFERRDYTDASGVYQLPDIRQEQFQYNTQDLTANFYIKFETDINDKNTIQEYRGTSFQATQQPIIKSDERLITIKGLKQINIPFALGKRKEDLTGVEKIVDVFFSVIGGALNALIKVVNAVISVINVVIKITEKILKLLKFFGLKPKFDLEPVDKIDPVDFGSIINDRLGMLMLENDFIDVSKLIIFNEASNDRQSDLHPDNQELLSAKKLWEDFHSIEAFAPSSGRPQGNQWITKTISDTKFCFDAYRKIKASHAVKTREGYDAQILKLEWNPWETTADITYRYNQCYTNNIELKTSEPDGQ